VGKGEVSVGFRLEGVGTTPLTGGGLLVQSSGESVGVVAGSGVVA